MNEAVVAAIKTLMNELNVMGSSHHQQVIDSIYDTVSREHRTLQQAFWSAMLKVQIKYADNAYDLRNEYAVNLANAVKQVAVEHNFDMGLPHI